jgi:protein-S-isoprenylcysteine O-methyltransferase Ste14
VDKQEKKIYIAAILAVVLILFLALVYFFPSKAQNGTDHVIIIAINSTLSMIIGFLFGSSSGSQEKDKSINEQTNSLISALANSTPVQPQTKESYASQAIEVQEKEIKKI